MAQLLPMACSFYDNGSSTEGKAHYPDLFQAFARVTPANIPLAKKQVTWPSLPCKGKTSKLCRTKIQLSQLLHPPPPTLEA